jgi:hypothetical protein
MHWFERLIEEFEKRYYGDLIMAFFEVIAIITGLLYVRKDKSGVFFLIYLIFDFSVLFSYYYIKATNLISGKELSIAVNIANSLIFFLALLIYYHFFFLTIQNSFVHRILKLLKVVFIIIIIIFVTTEFKFMTTRHSYVSYMICVTGFLFLIIPCFVYYYELFRNDPSINLYQRPSFWIVTGIFFYSVTSIPYFLINRFVFESHYENAFLINLFLFNLPCIINFIFLTIAFLCRKTLTI